MASSPSPITVTTTDSTVTVRWAKVGDMVTGYLVYYHHSDNNVTIVNRTSTTNSHTFNETTSSQRVYRVGVQALSEHLPSEIVGPVTARGQLFIAVGHVTHCHMLL